MPVKIRFFPVLILFVSIFLLFFQHVNSNEKNRKFDEAKNIHDDIQISNLLTGLFLSDDQIKQIMPLARKAGELKEAFQAKKESYAEKNIEILSAIRDEILRTGDPSELTKKRFHTIKSEFDNDEDNFKTNMKNLNKEVKKILTANQRIIVAEYKPCIIPVKSISNPEKIGQANGSEGIIKAIERARNTPDDLYAKSKEKILSRIAKKLEKYVKEKDIPGEIDRICKIIDEARSMSNADFEIKKSEMAEKIKPNNNEDPDEALMWKINRFLLNPRFISVIEMKSRLANSNSEGKK